MTEAPADRARAGEGTPADVAKVKESYTAQYLLRELLGRRSANGRGKRQAAE